MCINAQNKYKYYTYTHKHTHPHTHTHTHTLTQAMQMQMMSDCSVREQEMHSLLGIALGQNEALLVTGG